MRLSIFLILVSTLKVSGQFFPITISTEWDRRNFKNFIVISHCDLPSNRFDSFLIKEDSNDFYLYKSYCTPDSLMNITIFSYWPRMDGIVLTRQEFDNLYCLDFFFYRKRKWLKRFIYIRTTAVYKPGYKKISDSAIQEIWATKRLWVRWGQK